MAQTPITDSLLEELERQTIEQSQQPLVEDEYDDEEDTKDAETVIDTVMHLYAINLPADSIKSWKAKPEFSYMRNLDSLLKATAEQEITKPVQSEPSFMSKLFGSGMLRTILWIIAAVFVLVIIAQLLQSRGFFRRNASNPSATEEELPEEENIFEQRYETLLRNAVAEKAYRLAVRYHYLITLQNLSNRQLIEYAAEKTNSRYVHELPAQLRNDFAALLLHYEYVWYGKFPLSDEQFAKVQEGFQQFNKKN